MNTLTIYPSEYQEEFNDLFVDLELKAEAGLIDKSFNHEFGMEKVFDFETEGITKVLVINGKDREDISSISLLDFINNYISPNVIEAQYNLEYGGK